MSTVQCQRDPTWKNIKLGFSVSTIGSHGCAITCLSMWLNTVQPPDVTLYDPKIINATLKSNSGYVSGNLLLWRALPKIWPFIQYTGRIDMPTRPATAKQLSEIDRRLDQGNPVIIYVDSSLSAPGLQQHFVLIDSYLESGYGICDPWYGDHTSLLPRYGKRTEFAICGIILLDLDKTKMRMG